MRNKIKISRALSNFTTALLLSKPTIPQVTKNNLKKTYISFYKRNCSASSLASLNRRAKLQIRMLLEEAVIGGGGHFVQRRNSHKIA